MKIEGNTIYFKSDDDVYFKEEAGIKPNTVRFVWEKHELPMIVSFYKELQSEIKYIEIHNRRSPHLFFKRQVRDITWFEERLVWIISWFHEEDGIQSGYNAPIRFGGDRKVLSANNDGHAEQSALHEVHGGEESSCSDPSSMVSKMR